jgi:D-lactate dehydrogenase
MVNIVFFELEKFGLGDKKDYIKKALSSHEISFIEEPLSIDNASKASDAQVIACFIYSQINDSLLSKFSNLKLLVTMSTGFEHVDIAACKKRGIIACNVPSYGENTVAEHAIALLLALTRKIVPSVERTKKGDFSLDGLRGTDLNGKTMGVVGTGKIGKNVAKYARAFGMRVIAYDRFPDNEFAKKEGISYVLFDDLLADSDFISLHAPETKETFHLINVNNVRKIKSGCFLVNTARGSLVETEALLIGLKEGIFAGVGLDVLEEEYAIREEMELLHEHYHKKFDMKTLLEEHILLEQPNVIITPHNAFNTNEALMRILDSTVDNINAFLAGVPRNVIKG